MLYQIFFVNGRYIKDKILTVIPNEDKSLFKATLGETLRKEAYAHSFNATEGTVAVRENTSIINTSAELLAEELYTLVANMFKTKTDEIHRVVDSLKSVLMSRMQEAKLSNIDGFVGG